MKMKRKRKNACPSPLLDSPKRTKVHAQRKFAQGSNVNSPVITPIRELESVSPQDIMLPEPVELLPIKRPNTEDFLTFLCFRGTPILPPSLNFFNTASIVDTNGQVHEIKSESFTKNGPIDIAKCGTSSDKPFVAFGVRKRADPIVISRQMDRKRRHALALQALRRKYQEQKMAKIRAITISKLSEKVTNKTLVRTNTVSKTETITKKTNTNTLQKTKVVATKHIKVTTRTLKTTMRPKMKMKQNMCLRSFRGRFIQQELPFRKRIIQNKPFIRNPSGRKMRIREKSEESDSKSKSNEPSTSKKPKPTSKKFVKKIITTPSSVSARSTRSNLINSKSEMRRKQIKRILIPNPHTILKPKPRSLRLTTLKKSVLSRRQNRPLKVKSRLRQSSPNTSIENSNKKETRTEQKKTVTSVKGDLQKMETRNLKETINQTLESKESNKSKDVTKSYKKITNLKEVSKTLDRNKRHLTRSIDNRREVNISTDIKLRPNLAVTTKKSKICNVIHKKVNTFENRSSNEKPNAENKNSDTAEETNKRTTRRTDSLRNNVEKHEEGKRKSTGYSKNSKDKFSDQEDSSNESDSGNKNKSAINKSKLKTAKDYDENSSDTDTIEPKKDTLKNIKKTKQNVPKESSKVMNEKVNKSTSKSEKDINDKKDTKFKQIIQKEQEPDKAVEVKCGRSIGEKTVKDTTNEKSNIPVVEIELDLGVKKANQTKKDSDKIIEENHQKSIQKNVKPTKNSNEKENILNTEDFKKEKVEIESVKLKDNIPKEDSVGGKKENVEIKNTTRSNLQINSKIDQNDSIKLKTAKIEQIRPNNPKIVQIDSIKPKYTKIEVTKHNDEDNTEKIKNKKGKHTETEDTKKETLLIQDFGEISSTEYDVALKKCKRDQLKDYDKEECVTRSQRPSRKTKEAAAIYMEILSHKLVNDGKGDDDNVSIDSFPELPNVKRTQQRENELKAKAKESDGVELKSAVLEVQEPDTIIKKTKIIKETEKEVCLDDIVNKISDVNTNTSIKNVSSESIVVAMNNEQKINPGNSKRKSLNENSKDFVKPKLRKSEVSKSPEVVKDVEEIKPRRLVRNASQVIPSDDNDSDESFHVYVKVPRKKKNTRSRVSTRVTKSVKNLNLSSSDSDQSTTSDLNIQPTTSNVKNKKFSKTKSMKKIDNSFSDSDDEPLSKRTGRSIESSQKSLPKSCKVKDSSGAKETAKPVAKSKPTQKSPEPECSKIEPKPKRECAKLPQNYLPMLSSSDEDEIFHGFDEKTKTKTKSFEVACTHAPPLLDLLNKDLGRRFGKEKVNMSNEQIEKWLKDSALAGNSIKKENDEMLKFGEIIPTETSLEISGSIDTEKLKESLLGDSKKETQDVKIETSSSTPAKTEDIPKPKDSLKPQVDRKLIFRKSKSETTPAPNINAFSPENESSVYAFGEENEETISTPFRRPSRRPSSTATSKSEDESSKLDEFSKIGPFRKPSLKQDTFKGVTKDESETILNSEIEDSKQFYIPQNPTKSAIHKVQNKYLFKSKSSEKIQDIDEFKYKVPSSPSASSSSSAKLYKRQAQKQKNRSVDFMTPIYVSDFPKNDESPKLVEAPVFHPTDQEFQDPLEYIERIRHKAEQFGICKIVPPSSFKPECKVTDDMRFTAYNQYVNKMLYRWGPNFKEFMAIKKYLETQSISLSHPPWIGGMEIDLPRLYQTVQTLGGLKEVIEKKKWSKVSELMKIPKSAQDRVTKLDDIYCKYLLPYDTLSPAEREKLFDEVETEWAKKESRNLVKTQVDKLDTSTTNEVESDIYDDSEECITKGRNMALNSFYRIARNTMSMYFKNNEPLPQEVEQEYWKYVMMRQNHICVHSGSIDCGNWGYGFAVTKNSPFAKHPWNLKILTNNTASVLRSLGPLMGVTVPTLHVGMVFSACCWYRDPHGLPWIEYLHTGGTKIWYGIPNSMGDQFQSTLKTLVPNYCKNKELWLDSDTIMVPPNLLVENNVSLCHTVQEPGQFIVVFPKAFTSSISTGYVVSESVFFAPTYWLKTARALFDGLRQSNEPAMFSLDRLLISIANDAKCNIEIMRQVLPLVQELCNGEWEKRNKLGKLGEVTREKLTIPEVTKGKKKKLQQGEEGDYECEICRCSLFLSMIFDTVEGITYCLDHTIEMIEKKELDLGICKFMFTYDDEEIKLLPDKLKTSLDTRLQKKVPNKFSGMPTLLGRYN